MGGGEPSVRTLYVLRHAKSTWNQLELADHERPLAPRGRRAARALAGRMERLGISPKVVLCSTATRARETLEALAPALAAGVQVCLEDDLYAAGVEELLIRLHRLPDSETAVLLVGHNPGLQDLVLELCGDGDPDELDRLREKFPTCALATLTVENCSWAELTAGSAVLRSLLVPG